MMATKALAVLIVGVVVLTGGLLPPSVLPADLMIGCVDIQKAVNECVAGKEAKKALVEEVEKLNRLAIERQKEVQEMKESVEKQIPFLNPEARIEKEKEYLTKLRDFQRWGEDRQNELNQRRIETERNISLGLQKVIQKMGTNEGYTLIMEKNETIMLFNSKLIDITDKVIKAYDAERK
jgi:outer membrane protein